MEPAAAWGPCGFQLAQNWTTVEEPGAEVWAPTTGFPVEYASIFDKIGAWNLQAYVPHEYSGGQQLVGHYNYSAAPQHDGQNGEKTIIVSNDPHARDVFKQVRHDFKVDIGLMEEKMHRYPAVLGPISECYTVPRIVAIGRYHHNRAHLKQAEKVKHMAAIQCVRESGHLLEELYSAVVNAADNARCLGLYDKDVMEDQSLRGFLAPNRIDIRHEVMLLENQLPWMVVEAVMRFTPKRFMGKLISKLKGYLQDNEPAKQDDATAESKSYDENYTPPHLLGLLRYYAVGKSDDHRVTEVPKKITFSISAMELAKIGIKLTADKMGDLVRMGLHQEGKLFAELSLAPLSLDRNRASYLVNLAALELCTVKSFGKALDEESVVCSYLLLLAMLVNRDEDVQELRARGILQGGGGLTNQEALSFFTSFQGLRFGRCYYYVMRDIEIYKKNRRMVNRLYVFIYNNWKIITGFVTCIGVVVSIIAPLVSIKKAI